MENLSHTDLLALNRAIGELYSTRDIESFYRSAFSSIQRLIPCELCSATDASPNPTRFLAARASSQTHSTVFHKRLPALNAHLHEHPVILQFFSDNVFKTSDYATKSKFKSLAVYHEYYKHLDIEAQFGFSLPLSRDKVALFALNRKSPDYSERDRLLLTLLKPHMMSALRNAMEHSRMTLERDLLQIGAEARSQGAVLVQSDGTILCITPFAKEFFIRQFGATLAEGDPLPAGLLTWFKTRNTLKSVERPSLTIEKDDRSVKVTLLNDFTTGDYVLIMSETDTALLMQNLQSLGLSCREVEVLTWLAKGKTNGEIGIILNMSRRTVEKHLEHVFAKLGVGTRAAAAAMMNG